ncbi:MAG: hypothetical protein DMD84_19820, partial [Candidatus Rokuibacteriota bacterium]
MPPPPGAAAAPAPRPSPPASSSYFARCSGVRISRIFARVASRTFAARGWRSLSGSSRSADICCPVSARIGSSFFCCSAL